MRNAFSALPHEDKSSIMPEFQIILAWRCPGMFFLLHLLQLCLIGDIIHIIRLGSGTGIQCGDLVFNFHTLLARKCEIKNVKVEQYGIFLCIHLLYSTQLKCEDWVACSRVLAPSGMQPNLNLLTEYCISPNNQLHISKLPKVGSPGMKVWLVNQ